MQAKAGNEPAKTLEFLFDAERENAPTRESGATGRVTRTFSAGTAMPDLPEGWPLAG